MSEGLLFEIILITPTRRLGVRLWSQSATGKRQPENTLMRMRSQGKKFSLEMGSFFKLKGYDLLYRQPTALSF
jgi:hypothetical protein